MTEVCLCGLGFFEHFGIDIRSVTNHLSGGQKFSDWDVFDSIITQVFQTQNEGNILRESKMSLFKAQADLNCQEKLSDDISKIEQTNEDGGVLGTQPDEINANLNTDVSSQDSMSSQDKEFYRLLHRDSQTLENESTVEQNIAAEKLLISWDEIPITTRKNESFLIESPPSPTMKPGTSEQSNISDKNSVKQ